MLRIFGDSGNYVGKIDITHSQCPIDITDDLSDNITNCSGSVAYI